MYYIIYLIICSITAISNFYIISKLTNIKLNKFIIVIALETIILFILYFFNIPINYLKFFLIFILTAIIFYTDINIAFMSTLLLFIINSICEMLICIILISFNVDLNNISFLLFFIINILISFLSILTINISFLQKFTSTIFRNTKKYKLQIICITICIVIFILIKFINPSTKIIYIFLFSFIFFTIILIIKTLTEKEKIKNNIKQYNKLLNIITEYEKIIEQNMKNSHEFKNQLIIISAMSDNKKLKNYIQNQINQKPNILNNDILAPIQSIPFKGLKGLLYYKIDYAIKKEIKVDLDISNNFKNLKISDNDIQDICKLVGIFMDNAIDASSKVSEKQISISIYMSSEFEFIISIANKFRGTVDINYLQTTKGYGHGYGLKIAKDIIDENPKIKNTRECISNVFIQNIILKLK